MTASLTSPACEHVRPRRALRPVRIWLYAIVALVAGMILVGGATRLTESGLSITEWQLVSGVMPPLSAAEWKSEFSKYRQTTEYQAVNRGMSLQEFKSIYWWEWAHRFLGRLIGLIFLIPFLWFWLRGHFKNNASRVFVLFLLGAMQGALGWWMVTSGLVGRVDVSQYRLAAHLSLAFVILGYALWLAMTIGRAAPFRWSQEGVAAAAILALLFLQIAIGGIVAGLNAGLASDTWPLMRERWIPDGIWVLSPAFLNLTENPLTAQFLHRLLGYLIAVSVIAISAMSLRGQRDGPVRFSSIALLVLVILQVVLGVATVVTRVELLPALAHQAGAIALFCAAIWHLRNLGAATPSTMPDRGLP